MIIEALAQAAGMLAFVTADVVPDEITRFYFVGIDKARFRKPVEPGDQLILTAKLERQMRGIWKFSTVAYVGDDEVTSAEMMVAPETNKTSPRRPPREQYRSTRPRFAEGGTGRGRDGGRLHGDRRWREASAPAPGSARTR